MKTQTLKFNFAMNLLLTASNFLFPLITFPYVSRILGPVGTGKVAFSYSIVSYFTIFAAFGVANYGIRACARVRDNKDELSKTVQEILIINAMLMVFVYLIYAAGVFFIPEMNREYNLFLISGVNILFTIVGVEWLYKGIEQYYYITIRSIIFKFISFILIFTCVKSHDDYTIYAFIVIFATVGSGIVNLYNLNNVIKIKRYTKYNFKKHIKPMMTFFVITIAVAFYVNVSVALLGFLKGNAEVGYYNAAYKMKDVMVSIITSLGAVLLPRLSYYIENGMQNKFNEIIEKSMQFIFIMSLPLVVFCIIFSKVAISILAGHAYEHSTIPLQILSVIILIVGISNLTGIQMLIPLKKENYLCYSVVVAAIINIIMNFFLINRFGAIGAAVSVSCAELSILIIQVYVLKEYFFVLFAKISYAKILCSLFLASVIAVGLNGVKGFSDVIVFLISASVFFLVYFVMLIIMKESFILSVLNSLKSSVIRVRD